MTSTIKVDNIQNQCGANIINESSNTITIGASGDTVTLASGASQTGFGRTGTVDWQTGSIKTATFTAANGEGYFCNTTSGGFTVNLPAGSAGAIVSVQDYNNTFDSNALTLTPNGSEKINGGAGNLILNAEGQGLTLVYVDGTVGWRSVQENEFETPASTFIAATGGTITTSGDFKIHTFTGPGTFTVTSSGSPAGSDKVSYMVVAGGASGGAAEGGGGGGAGGFREGKASYCAPYTASPIACTSGANAGLPVSVQAYPITVGAGGATHPFPSPGTRGNCGSTSTFSTISSAGGGGGGMADCTPARPGNSGGSGGGGGEARPSGTGSGGAGNTPPVSPAQGQPGGAGNPGTANPNGAGGGGGATDAGTAGQPGGGGDGGDGATTSITGSPTTYAGGGGGGVYGPGTKGAGGPGGGGEGGRKSGGAVAAAAGTANTGGGGGGASEGAPGSYGNGGAGGSGVVIIRYKFQ